MTSLLRRLDAHPLWSFPLRLPLAVLLFYPYGWEFIPTVFRMDDVEPWVLELAKQQGLDLADSSVWHTQGGLIARIVGLMLLATGAWWGVSRLRRGARGLPQPWFGAVWLGFAGLVFAATWGLAGRLMPVGSSMLPVWGGWVHASLLSPLAMTFALFFTLLAAAIESRLHVLELRQRMQDMQDLALRTRLAPHFLLNSFNTLIAQIEESPREAAATAERLSSLFRGVMEASRSATVPLRQELAFVEDLLALAKDRFGARLQVSIDVPEELLDRLVPVLGLQVLVENALKHGVEPRKGGGLVRIEAWEDGADLRVAVTDPGDGTPGERGSGQSLESLRQRLVLPEDLEMTPVPSGFWVSFRWRG